MKALGGFAASSLAAVAVSYLAAAAFFESAAEREALRLAAVAVLVVQVLAFPAVRVIVRRNLVAGWGLGTMLRVALLVVAALVAVPVLRLDREAALVGTVIFLFVTTLVEPIFLK
jgi:hypothetical protein